MIKTNFAKFKNLGEQIMTFLSENTVALPVRLECNCS